jgi:hypothetical protein
MEATSHGVAPSAISIADNATGTVATASCTMSDASLCAGATFPLNDPHTYLTVSGASINRTGTALVDGTYTDLQLQACKNGICFPPSPTNNLTLTVNPSGGGGGGVGGALLATNNFSNIFHTNYGRYPDYTNAMAYMTPDAVGCWPFNARGGYPWIASFSLLDHSNPTRFQDAHQAATGGYDNAYQNTIDTCLKPAYNANQLYVVRLNWEWYGPACGITYGVCPFPDFNNQNVQRITPTDYINMMRRGIGLIKASMPNVKVEFDAPMSAIEETYWPGDDVVDITGLDLYFQTSEGTSALDVWNHHTALPNANGFNGNLTVLNNWAVAQ